MNNDAIPEGRTSRFGGAMGTWGWLCGDNGYGTEDASINENGIELADLGDSQAGESAPFEAAFIDMTGGSAIATPSFGQWVAVRIEVRGSQIKVFYNGVEFFNVTSNSTTGHAMPGYEDPFSSVASEPDSVCGVFDNFIVETVCSSGKRE